MSQRKAIREAAERLALKGMAEMDRFLDTYRGDDPAALARVKQAAVALTGLTRIYQSDGNMIGSLVAIAERTGVSPERTLEAVDDAGVLPGSVASKLKLLKIAK